MNRAWRVAAAVAAAHAILVLILCWDMVLFGRVPYVRDVLFLYVPDFAFLAQSLAQRVWPLWNPLIDGGRPVLFAYLPDVALVGLLGPLGAARAEIPLIRQREQRTAAAAVGVTDVVDWLETILSEST